MHAQYAMEIANFRYRLIAPIVSRPELPPGQLQVLLREAATKTYQIPHSHRTRVSVRSLERYLRDYRRGGYDALKPRTRHGRSPRLPASLLNQAAALKRENPRRSCVQIIEILERSGQAPAGMLKKSTLYDFLDRQGLTRRHTPTTRAYQRYQARYRNQRWIGDTCQLLTLTDPAGVKRKVHLIAWLDDFSRLVTHLQGYWAERLPMLEDSLKKAILKYGVPEQIYTDLAKIYTSRHLETVCAKLGIQHSLGRPYRPAGRGKIERFFATLQQSFLPEFQQLMDTQAQSLDDLNQHLRNWLTQYYHEKRHSATKQSPRLRFETDVQPLRTVGLEALQRAFWLEETRLVDKTMRFALQGQTFQTVPELVRQKITVCYDPYDLTQVEVYCQGRAYPPATEARTPEQGFPVQRAKAPPPASPGLNFLSVLQEQTREGISFRTGGEE